MEPTARRWLISLIILTTLSCVVFSPGSSPEDTFPAPADDSSLPQEAPTDFFEGVPIMPGAVAGKAVGTTYTYQINASVLAVQVFYLREMPLAGWEFEDQTGDAKLGETSIRLRYWKGDELAAIFIHPADGGLAEVTIL
jgi:hypothetical protein